jgi:hypothetical protein
LTAGHAIACTRENARNSRGRKWLYGVSGTPNRAGPEGLRNAADIENQDDAQAGERAFLAWYRGL